MDSLIEKLSDDSDKLEEKIALDAFGMKVVNGLNVKSPVAVAKVKTALTRYVISVVQK